LPQNRNRIVRVFVLLHQSAAPKEGVTSLKMGRVEGCSRGDFPEGLGAFPESRKNPVVFPKIRESPGVTRNLRSRAFFFRFGPESEQEHFGRLGSKVIRNAVDSRAKRSKDFELFWTKRGATYAFHDSFATKQETYMTHKYHVSFARK
jgi:hypothetical protein